jgi:hypothetical protein
MRSRDRKPRWHRFRCLWGRRRRNEWRKGLPTGKIQDMKGLSEMEKLEMKVREPPETPVQSGVWRGDVLRGI